jgi:transposase
VRRYGLRDDQWDRIKNLLPGRPGSVGVTAADHRLFVEAVLYRYRAGIRGPTCRNASVTARTSTAASASGRSLASGKGSFNIRPLMRTTNTR